MIPARIKSPTGRSLALDQKPGEVDFEAGAGQGRQDQDPSHFAFAAARRCEEAGQQQRQTMSGWLLILNRRGMACPFKRLRAQ
jgi:hypothetical protein